jgi:hypothetical protein
MWAGRAMLTNETPIQLAQIRPTMYCPLPPMLKRPQRKANATASPQRIRVVVWRSVWLKLYAAVPAMSVFHGWASQLRPAPLTMSQ